MSDEEALSMPGLFCACPAGQAKLSLIRRRAEGWKQFLQDTEQATKAALRKRYEWSGIPPKFAGLTLGGLWLKAQTPDRKTDPGKAEAILLAKAFMAHGQITKKTGVVKKSLLVWGEKRGVGKTGCLAPIMVQWLEAGKTAYWLDFREFIDLIKQSYKDPTATSAGEMLAAAKKADILLIDDLGDPGRDSAETDHTREVMTNIIRYRHGADLPTLVTTNQPPTQLTRQFSEELFHRLAEMAVIVEMGGQVIRELG